MSQSLNRDAVSLLVGRSVCNKARKVQHKRGTFAAAKYLRKTYGFGPLYAKLILLGKV